MKKTTFFTAVLLISSAAFAGNYRLEKKSKLRNGETNWVIAKDTGQSQIEYNKLPANIQYAVKEQYPNFEPTKMATKMVAEGQTIYYVTVESDSRIIGLRCNTDGEIMMQSSSRKSKP